MKDKISNLSILSKKLLISAKNIIKVPMKLIPNSSINEINIDTTIKRKNIVTTFFSKMDNDLRNIFFLFNINIKLTSCF